jgi:ADP-dependent phosphofructokinase/glucokinase
MDMTGVTPQPAASTALKIAGLLFMVRTMIDSIRHIASGDLVKRIDVEGTNEMGQLAETLPFQKKFYFQQVLLAHFHLTGRKYPAGQTCGISDPST